MRRGRFAPTPSGQLHIGNAWTALLSWLQMRHVGGEFVLRMEDIDKPRSRQEYADQILDDLRWLGLDWDEGPDRGGPHGSYTQSEREALYEEALEQLQNDGWLYPCYCSRADLKSIASAPHGLAAEGPIYLGRCRGLTPEERAVKAAAKMPSLRFAMPAEREISFADVLAGEHRGQADVHGDFVIKRADGIIAYQLAVVVDDAAMRITDVLRGSDLLDSTTRQLVLYEALGLEAPDFCHVPLLCGPDGERLSKRNGAVTTIAQMRSTGTKPEQVIGWLAFLSNLQQRPEPVQAAELVDAFDLSRVPKDTVTVSEAMLRELHCL